MDANLDPNCGKLGVTHTMVTDPKTGKEKKQYSLYVNKKGDEYQLSQGCCGGACWLARIHVVWSNRLSNIERDYYFSVALTPCMDDTLMSGCQTVGCWDYPSEYATAEFCPDFEKMNWGGRYVLGGYKNMKVSLTEDPTVMGVAYDYFGEYGEDKEHYDQYTRGRLFFNSQFAFGGWFGNWEYYKPDEWPNAPYAIRHHTAGPGNECRWFHDNSDWETGAPIMEGDPPNQQIRKVILPERNIGNDFTYIMSPVGKSMMCVSGVAHCGGGADIPGYVPIPSIVLGAMGGNKFAYEFPAAQFASSWLMADNETVIVDGAVYAVDEEMRAFMEETNWHNRPTAIIPEVAKRKLLLPAGDLTKFGDWPYPEGEPYIIDEDGGRIEYITSKRPPLSEYDHQGLRPYWQTGAYTIKTMSIERWDRCPPEHICNTVKLPPTETRFISLEGIAVPSLMLGTNSYGPQSGPEGVGAYTGQGGRDTIGIDISTGGLTGLRRRGLVNSSRDSNIGPDAYIVNSKGVKMSAAKGKIGKCLKYNAADGKCELRGENFDCDDCEHSIGAPF